ISIPLALCGSVGSVLGAQLGLSIQPDVVLGLLAAFMFFVAGHTAWQVIAPAPGNDAPHGDAATETVGKTRLSDRIASLWRLQGAYRDPATGETIRWRVRRIVPAMTTFVGVGGIGGMLGIGAGWANVPILASMMGLPIKLAAATSGLVIIANSSAAAWVYLHRGAIRPLVVVPALVGMIAGTRVGARILGKARARSVRIVVIVVLTSAAVQTLIGVLS
ncbi:MAG: sulfite exporter TauE/SafE family protein, partial [Spirochaetales bacterium]|nr:sulfite exporter TauE/SafE family protein [Spirochaetales bacterium]